MNTDPTANYHGGNPESTEAYASVASTTANLRRRVVSFIRMRGAFGATSDEIEAFSGVAHQTISARITEAKARGLLIDSGLRRKTRSGRTAAVLITPEHKET